MRERPYPSSEATGQIPVDVRSQPTEAEHQEGGRRDAVRVVVTVDDDPAPLVYGGEDGFNGALHVGNRNGSGRGEAALQELSGGGRVRQPPARQHHGGHLRYAQLLREPGGFSPGTGVDCPPGVVDDVRSAHVAVNYTERGGRLSRRGTSRAVKACRSAGWPR